MGELLTPTHLVIVLVVALLLFGPRKLPELGKGLGEGLRGFKEGMFPVAEKIGRLTVTLPMFNAMTFADVERAVAAVKSVLNSAVLAK